MRCIGGGTYIKAGWRRKEQFASTLPFQASNLQRKFHIKLIFLTCQRILPSTTASTLYFHPRLSMGWPALHPSSHF
jgi:hypothetical protein